jgi:hypothetical protein
MAIWPRTLKQVAMWPCVQIHATEFGDVYFRHVPERPLVKIHVAVWTRVLIHVAMCNKYTWSHVFQ